MRIMEVWEMMEYKEIPIEEVNLDLNNPRIKQWIEMYGDEITSEGIALALSASAGTETTATYTALKESIRVNGGIITPILVNREPSGTMTVIEGNTRLQIYKEFHELDPEGPWGTIIAIIYDNLPQERIHAIRLQSHLVGPRDWDPFSKAKYLNQLSNIDKLPMEMIISFCGGKSSEIRKLIAAYRDMTKHYFEAADMEGIDRDPKEFSKFAELQNRSIKDALYTHKLNEKDFAQWVVRGNIDNAQNVRKLPAILSNPIAFEEFKKSTISEAVKYLNADEKGIKNLKDISMDDLVKELTNRILHVTRKETINLKNDPRFANRRDNILDLLDELTDFAKDIKED